MQHRVFLTQAIFDKWREIVARIAADQVKGGHNKCPSQVRKRPPAPRPTKPHVPR